MLDLLATQPSTSLIDDPFFLAIIGAGVTLLAGLIGAVVTYWIYRKQRSKKEISYQIISNAPIASVNKVLENRVTIQLDGKPVKDARQIVIKVRNNGNVAVKREDYDKQTKFIFEGSEVIGGELLNTEPESMMNSMDKDFFIAPYVREQNIDKGIADTVLLPNILLNPKEFITFTILLKGGYKHLDVRGRIVDGKISEFNPSNQLIVLGRSLSGIIYGIMAVLLIFGALIITLLPSSPSVPNGFNFLAALGITIGIAAGGVSIYEFIRAGSKR